MLKNDTKVKTKIKYSKSGPIIINGSPLKKKNNNEYS